MQAPYNQPLYNTIGATYGTTRHADQGISGMLAQLVGIHPDGIFLDLACGTGNYTSALAGFGGQWHGVDISERMLDQASAANPDIQWKLAGADALPYQDGLFNGAICTLAIHHFQTLRDPFSEVFRVLDAGPFVIFTAFPEQMRNYWLCHYFPEMMEHSIQQMPAKTAVMEALQDEGFTIDDILPYHVPGDLGDLFLYAGKNRPQLYLDPSIRSNISSFAALCPAEELQSGLQTLQHDLATGEFKTVAERYSGDTGDYAYVVARKHN